MAAPNDMDEFVNWDNAGDAAMGDIQMPPPHQDIDPALAGLGTNDMSWDNIDLMLANVNEDDFSFTALQHFSEQGPLSADMAAPLAWETPDVPCANCALGGYSCKKIREGRHKGYCTSCVALVVDCSFGGVVPENLNPESTTFPADAWPIMGDFHPNSIPKEDSAATSNSSSAVDLLNLAGNNSNELNAPEARGDAPPPKVGARFSRESVRILKNWLTSHNRHPYPSDEEKEMLQRKTGLNKTQITNWLANARRRGKVQAPQRSTSPHVSSYSTGVGSIDIPRRRGTPSLEAMNPLQRWQHSPPEHEPASATDIARAVTASSSGLSSGINSPHSQLYTDDGSNRSISASSLGTSHSSGGSLGSAFSHGSRNSWGSFGSAPFSNRGRRRRRRAATSKHIADKGELSSPLKTFQCTFCTETFRTKHDWQRHEKSLHLSLERWVCAPHGPRVTDSATGMQSCVFCGLANPDDDHIESHNHSTCQERSLEERTFYRKDHLNQHLRLVHSVKFNEASMKAWKIATPEIRSRCGFCGIVMDTWSIRIDHLAEHFKTGKSMADWKGDWGFEVPVLDMVENSIPPYLIHYERTSPNPYVADHSSPESPRNAYELIKLELSYFCANHRDNHGRLPTDEEMLLEGCRIIFASELLSLQGIATQVSWLRDLIMKSNPLVDKARFGRVRGATENRLETLKINGKDNLFELCPMESQLLEFVRTKELLGLTAMDDELQVEACKIVGRVEEVSTHPSDIFANWLIRMIRSSSHWLASFRRRAHLPRSEDVQDNLIRSTDPMNIDSTIHSYTRLERELADFLKMQRSLGVEPSDDDLQRQARIIIYEFDDGWNQTAADNIPWLAAFRERHLPEGSPPNNSAFEQSLSYTYPSTATTSSCTKPTWDSPLGFGQDPGMAMERDLCYKGSDKFAMFLNDANCYRRLERELGRWVTTTMSPHNPNRHVPSDCELQYQARLLIYDEEDPWNQTAADNAEWLERFKRDHGISQKPGPGLTDDQSWSLEQGGTGFEPPYVFPKPSLDVTQDSTMMSMNPNPHQSPTGRSAPCGAVMENYMSRFTRPATIFCSRDLEEDLINLTQQHVASTGRMPAEKLLKARAKQIVKCRPTPADDPVLLGKFQKWMAEKLPEALPATADSPEGPSALPSNMDVNLSDEELENILQDMNMDFLGGSGSGSGSDKEEEGGVSLTGFKD